MQLSPPAAPLPQLKGYMLLLEHGATDQVRKLVRQGAALKTVAVLALHK